MSQPRQTTPHNLTEGYSVTNLTLVVLLLIPFVVILLLLNCLFLGYKVLVLSKKTSRPRREDTEEMLLRSTLPRLRVPDVAFSPLRDGRTAYMSLSEPVLSHPVTSSRASSRDGAGLPRRIRLLRPDGDKLFTECEHTNLTSETSSLNTSAVGPGLDSDFGASAVSLRILSADSDGLSNGLLSSALEWDYYDPCYVRQNNISKHNHHRPVIHTKQYWV
uniref:Huluwa n=1 Tax=Poecilia latipinna TaxID=48699 RepID=A0A3B3U1P4_9TELE